MDLTTLKAPVTSPYDLHHHHRQAQANQHHLHHHHHHHQHKHLHHHSIYGHAAAAAAPSTSPINSSDDDKPRSAFHRHQPTSMLSPPELLHDSEEDEESSTGSPTMTLHLDPVVSRSIRKSIPHRSPPAVKDAIQASALDKSVVFQLDVRSHPFFPAPAALPTSPHDRPICPDCKLKDCCGMACTSRVICGESLLTALRKRVAQARNGQQQQQQKQTRRHRMALQHRSLKRSTSRKPTHIDIPQAPSSRHHHTDDGQEDTEMSEAESEEQQKRLKEIRRRPWIEELAPPQPPQQQPQQQEMQVTPHQQQQEQEREPSATEAMPTPLRKRSPPAGRPSRVKGPCQACQESSDGCMRKAFNWPFPTSSVYNDKGKKFVYLCNKCGLRYNKSGGCVCRHCRWVFCKEEKRKAMQHIERMIRLRPNGRIDPDEDIEGFVCTPKYWTCGRPWKVGWVLQNNADDEDDEDMHDATD